MLLLRAGATIADADAEGLTYRARDRLAAATQRLADTFAYANEFHRIANNALSNDVEVDTRIGLTLNGLYQEPLERVLEYLGLHMSQGNEDDDNRPVMREGAQNTGEWARRGGVV